MLKLLLKKKKIPVKYWMKISHNIIKIYIYSYIKIWAHKKKKKTINQSYIFVPYTLSLLH